MRASSFGAHYLAMHLDHESRRDMTPPKYFLSYSRKNLNEIKSIAKGLMLHGVETWQDISDLGTGMSETSIRGAIQSEVDGLVFLATQESVDSIFIRDVELPEAEQRVKKGNFPIVPVFGMPLDKASSALTGCLSVPLSNFNGAKIDGALDERSTAIAGERAAEIVLENTNFPSEQALIIGLSSKQKLSGNMSLHLNFMAFFADGSPAPIVWNTRFTPALTRIKEVLNKRSLHDITVRAFCHLSLGMLLGYVFRKTSGFSLQVEQVTNGERNLWTTKGVPTANPLTVTEMPGTLGSKNLLIRMNLMSADNKSVLRYAEENSLSYRAILDVSPTHYPCMISAEEALSIASDVADKVKELHAKHDTSVVHLFCAIPLGLAVLMGHSMNACGTIQCYEFDNAQRRYSPSCTLE